ncbi:MAG: hypothetical protein ABJ308_10470 [Halieaceae bacterium]
MLGDWNAQVAAAACQLDGSPRAADVAADLEYCVQVPAIWQSDARGGCMLRCSGWAVSHGGRPVQVKIADHAGVRKWLRPMRSRPDVLQHYVRKGVEVSEFCGYDFLLAMQGLQQPAAALSIEIMTDDCSSGVIPFDIHGFYQQHRQQLGHDQVYHGFEPAPGTRGRLDFAAGERVLGWAQRLETEQPVSVELFINGQLKAQQLADRYREDLVTMRVSASGSSGFEFELDQPLQAGDEVRVEIPGEDQLTNSPLRVG